MAFIRSYARQGDPLGSPLYRAGLLVRPKLTNVRRGPGIVPGRFFTPSHPFGYMRSRAFAGDPFLGKLFKKAGKALKKVTLKGVVKGVASVAKFAAPLILPGVGGALAGALLGGGGGSAAQEAAPVYAEPAAPASPVMDPAMFRAMLEQYIAEQQAQQAAQEQAMLAQWQYMQAMQSPSFSASPWRF